MTTIRKSASSNWISIEDEQDRTTWLIDKDFLSSNFQCIYGKGCQSIEAGPDSVKGCCSVGAHFADADDLENVKTYLGRLDSSTWQNFDKAKESGGPFEIDGDEATTKIVDGACVFLNREGFAGGTGCALHAAALKVDERPMDWKPMVCWQVPIRMDLFEDEFGHTTATIRAWQRRDWGDGGNEFHWWCTENEEAYSGAETTFASLKDELTELMGEHIYQQVGRQMQNSIPSVSVEITKKS